MKVPPIGVFRNFGVVSNTNNTSRSQCLTKMIEPLEHDTLSFSSKARYIRKYNSLPDEIKDYLPVSDAEEVFTYMENVAKTIDKINKNKSKEDLEESPVRAYAITGKQAPLGDCQWYFIVAPIPNSESQKVKSPVELSDSIWADPDDTRIQIMRAIA